MVKTFDVEKFLYILCTNCLNHVCGVRKSFFNSTNSKFSNSDSTRFNNTAATSTQVKKESNSTLKYVAMATPTQQYGYKQVVELESPESHVLDRSRSTFFRFDEIAVANRSLFF